MSLDIFWAVPPEAARWSMKLILFNLAVPWDSIVNNRFFRLRTKWHNTTEQKLENRLTKHKVSNDDYE